MRYGFALLYAAVPFVSMAQGHPDVGDLILGPGNAAARITFTAQGQGAPAAPPAPPLLSGATEAP